MTLWPQCGYAELESKGFGSGMKQVQYTAFIDLSRKK